MTLAQELEDMGVSTEPNLVVLTQPKRPEPVSPEMIAFERCKGWLEAGLEHNDLTMPDVLAAIADGRATFWPGEACAVVTEVLDFDGVRIVRVMTAGGDKDELKSLRPGIFALARLQGCTEARIEGRKGWERELKAEGFEFHSVVLRKSLLPKDEGQ